MKDAVKIAILVKISLMSVHLAERDYIYIINNV